MNPDRIEIHITFDESRVRARGRELIRSLITARLTADDTEELLDLMSVVLEELREPMVAIPDETGRLPPLEELVSSMMFSTVEAAFIVNRLLDRAANLEGVSRLDIWRETLIDLDPPGV